MTINLFLDTDISTGNGCTRYKRDDRNNNDESRHSSAELDDRGTDRLVDGRAIEILRWFCILNKRDNENRYTADTTVINTSRHALFVPLHDIPRKILLINKNERHAAIASSLSPLLI
ncbi:hypothetical protein QTP88_023395 [Uroleucon formosanum]